jgi:hypothetical protein
MPTALNLIHLNGGAAIAGFCRKISVVVKIAAITMRLASGDGELGHHS